jgi:cob(I)alamin adenosyltransferase
MAERTKIYTKKGDRGETSLIFGQRVRKDHPRIKSVGAVDELNASIGTAASFIKDKKMVSILQNIQNELFNIGTEIASPKKLKKPDPPSASRRSGTKQFYSLSGEKTAYLEQKIDLYQEKLPTLQEFILPSGTPGSAHLHLARTVCRRAERQLVTLSRRAKINENIFKFLNRLSDLLFVLARYENHVNKVPDIKWQKD